MAENDNASHWRMRKQSNVTRYVQHLKFGFRRYVSMFNFMITTCRVTLSSPQVGVMYRQSKAFCHGVEAIQGLRQLRSGQGNLCDDQAPSMHGEAMCRDKSVLSSSTKYIHKC